MELLRRMAYETSSIGPLMYTTAQRKLRFFDQQLALSRKSYKIKPITTEDEYELVLNLSNGAIFSDLEWPVI